MSNGESPNINPQDLNKIAPFIQEAIDGSEKIAHIILEFQKMGFAVYLALEATLQFVPLEGLLTNQQLLLPLRETNPLVRKDGTVEPGTFSSEDKKFAEGLRIIIDHQEKTD